MTEVKETGNARGQEMLGFSSAVAGMAAAATWLALTLALCASIGFNSLHLP